MGSCKDFNNVILVNTDMDLTIKTTLLSDFQENLVKQADEYSTSMYKAEAEPRPMNPILPPYPYKYPKIRPRSDYKGNFEEEYWQCWDKNPYDHSVNNFIILISSPNKKYKIVNSLHMIFIPSEPFCYHFLQLLSLDKFNLQ